MTDVTTTETDDDAATAHHGVSRTLRVLLVLAAAGVLVAAPFGLGHLVAVGAGAVLALLNLWVLQRVIHNVLRSAQPSAAWAAVGGLKLLVLLGVAGALLSSGLSPLSLAAGYALLPLAVVVAQVLTPAVASERG